MSPNWTTATSAILPPSTGLAFKSSAGHRQRLQLRGGWTPSLICVFTVTAVTDDGPEAFEADTVSGRDKESP